MFVCCSIVGCYVVSIQSVVLFVTPELHVALYPGLGTRLHLNVFTCQCVSVNSACACFIGIEI